MQLLFLTHLASTLVMTGIIWFVQVVHYPLFSRVGAAGFPAYSEAHSHLTTFVVGPPMIVEAATAVLLVFVRPEDVPDYLVWIGLILLAAVWLSTAALQVPRHTKLGLGFDPAVWTGLVATNWVRTAAWSLRAGVVLTMAGYAMK
ncbi:MAG TPA: hypothetical protein VFJ72_16780 [Rubrobacteraceae bacterium]|nr:hypothetical protein [Rubrobacteraceae bacterium]